MVAYAARRLSDTAFAEPATWAIYIAGLLIIAVEIIAEPLLRKLNRPKAANALKAVCNVLLIPVGILIAFELFFG